MAPLSRKLVGLVLKHNSFGDHLDSQGKTVDPDLEEKNFKKAADLLVDVWEEAVIDGNKVEAHAIDPGSRWKEVDILDEKWVEIHVRQSKYMLQIVKCSGPECCAPFRSNWLSVFPKRFLPCPATAKFTPTGRVPIQPSEVGQK